MQLENIHLSVPEIPEHQQRVHQGKLQVGSIKGIKVVDTRRYYKFLQALKDETTHANALNFKIDAVISNYKFEGVAEGEAFAISKQYDSYDLLWRLAHDFETYNCFAFEVIINKGKELHAIEPLDISQLFLDEELNIYYNEYEMSPLKLYEAGKGGVYIYKPTLLFEVPRPSYHSGIKSILTNLEITNYHLSNASSGFSAGAIVNIVEDIDASDEDKKQRADKIRQQVSGGKNGGGVLVNYATNQDSFAKIERFTPTGIEKVFESTAIQMQNNILSAHQVEGELIGIKNGISMFDRAHLKESYILFSEFYLKNRCRIIEQSVNFVFSHFKSLADKKLRLTPKPLFQDIVQPSNAPQQ